MMYKKYCKIGDVYIYLFIECLEFDKVKLQPTFF